MTCWGLMTCVSFYLWLPCLNFGLHLRLECQDLWLAYDLKNNDLVPPANFVWLAQNLPINPPMLTFCILVSHFVISHWLIKISSNNTFGKIHKTILFQGCGLKSYDLDTSQYFYQIKMINYTITSSIYVIIYVFKLPFPVFNCI